MERVEAARKSDGGLELGGSDMIFVGNSKVTRVIRRPDGDDVYLQVVVS